MKWLILILIAFICGSLGAKLAGSSGKGCVTSIVIGFIGALIGSWLSEKLGIGDFFYWTQYKIPILWSIVGAALFVSVLSLFSSGRGKS